VTAREHQELVARLDPRDQEYVATLDPPEREIVVATILRYQRPDRLDCGDPVPDLALQRLNDGTSVSLAELGHGRPLVFGSFT
jgi:hypothetical protein